MQFLEKICQIVGWLPPPPPHLVVGTPSGKSWIRHCIMWSQIFSSKSLSLFTSKPYCHIINLFSTQWKRQHSSARTFTMTPNTSSGYQRRTGLGADLQVHQACPSSPETHGVSPHYYRHVIELSNTRLNLQNLDGTNVSDNYYLSVINRWMKRSTSRILKLSHCIPGMLILL